MISITFSWPYEVIENGRRILENWQGYCHYNDVMMSPMASQITSLMIVYSTVYSGADQKISNLCVTGLCEENSPVTVNSQHRGPVTRKMLPFDDAIMVVLQFASIFFRMKRRCLLLGRINSVRLYGTAVFIIVSSLVTISLLSVPRLSENELRHSGLVDIQKSHGDSRGSGNQRKQMSPIAHSQNVHSRWVIAVDLKKHTCHGCFVRNYHFMNSPVNLCGGQIQKLSLDMVIGISSHPNDVAARRVLRHTWLSHTKNNTSAHVRHVFLLGANPRDNTLQERISQESKLYNDILQQDFIDHYDNLTVKSMMLFEWVDIECRNARYVFKVDQDVYVNVPSVINIIRNTTKDDSVIGRCLTRVSPDRDSEGRWHVTREEYPESIYPPFCTGPHYLVPMGLVHLIPELSPNIPMLHLEDVYMGLLIKKAGYDVRDAQEFHRNTNKYTAQTVCSFIRHITVYHRVRRRRGRLAQTFPFADAWDKCHLGDML